MLKDYYKMEIKNSFPYLWETIFLNPDLQLLEILDFEAFFSNIFLEVFTQENEYENVLHFYLP